MDGFWATMQTVKHRYMCYSERYEEILQFGTITKHTWGWEIDERNLKIVYLTHLHPKRIEYLGNKNYSSVNIRFVVKTSDMIRNFS